MKLCLITVPSIFILWEDSNRWGGKAFKGVVLFQVLKFAV